MTFDHLRRTNLSTCGAQTCPTTPNLLCVPKRTTAMTDVEAAPVETTPTLCMAADDATCDFKPKLMQRRTPGPKDVVIEMKYCGVCHSDLHAAANHMGSTKYPIVPGHELAGVVTSVGAECTKCKVGMHVGIGCLVDSCLECPKCLAGEEQQCVKGNSRRRRARIHGSGFSRNALIASPSRCGQPARTARTRSTRPTPRRSAGHWVVTRLRWW